MRRISQGLRLSVVAAAIGGATLLSACSSGQAGGGYGSAGTPAAATRPAAQNPVSQSSASMNQAAGSPAKLVAARSSVGTIVTDGSGMSLYRFDKDTAHPSVSNCAGGCATTWPPVIVAQRSSIQVQGVQQSDVGSIQRSDGSWQATIGGWPVYRYALDQKPGDVLGQGVGGTWFAVSPTGMKAGGSSAATSTSGSSGNYGSGSGYDSGSGSGY